MVGSYVFMKNDYLYIFIEFACFIYHRFFFGGGGEGYTNLAKMPECKKTLFIFIFFIQWDYQGLKEPRMKIW
jgi:hypothetical protein